jgi:predicted membrane-bound dolichyl-phosphate-mannose-protein mannosyltransferase
MKRIFFLFAGIALLSLMFFSSKQLPKTHENTSVEINEKVEVYYFHYSRRCPTCVAVEDVTKEALKEYYGENVPFTELNLDNEVGKAKGEALDISGQSLIIVKGDTKINLTNEGFMYARSNPEKLKQILKEKIDPLI